MVFNPFRRKAKASAETVQKSATPLAAGPRQETEKKPLPLLVKKSHTTEKASNLQALNLYVFQVQPRANKVELRKAVERHYGVHVQAIRIMNMPGKPRRVKGIRGWKTGYKKAMVTIRKGEKIVY